MASPYRRHHVWHETCTSSAGLTRNLYPEIDMARWAIVFFILSLLAAAFGFGGIAGEAAWIGKVLLFIFLILAVASMLSGRRARDSGL